MGANNALTAGVPRNTALFVIAALTMTEALIFGILFAFTREAIDDNRRIRGKEEKLLKLSAAVIMGVYFIAFLISIGLMFGAAKKRPGWLRAFFVFGIIKCIVKVAVSAVFINSGIIVAACVLIIICAVLNTYFIAIVAATEKEMRKSLNTPVATVTTATTNPRPFVGNHEGVQPPYNPGLRSYGNNDHAPPPDYNHPSGPPPSYFSETEAPPIFKK